MSAQITVRSTQGSLRPTEGSFADRKRSKSERGSSQPNRGPTSAGSLDRWKVLSGRQSMRSGQHKPSQVTRHCKKKNDKRPCQANSMPSPANTGLSQVNEGRTLLIQHNTELSEANASSSQDDGPPLGSKEDPLRLTQDHQARAIHMDKGLPRTDIGCCFQANTRPC